MTKDNLTERRERIARAMKKSWHAKLKDWPNIEEPDVEALERELAESDLAFVDTNYIAPTAGVAGGVCSGSGGSQSEH